MRPPSIVNFERAVLLYLVIGIANTIIYFDDTVASVAEQGFGSGLIIGVQAATVVLFLLLLWFISRKGSPVAKWIYVILSALILVSGLLGITQIFALGAAAAILAIAQYVLLAVSIWLLFRPDSKAWFAEGRGGDADAETFR